jgi:hypothetical protein
VSFGTSISYLHLSRFSKPKGERCLYRAIHELRPRKIVEMGVGMGLRSQRMIQLAVTCADGAPVEYTGIDLFEARPANDPGMTLKRAYRTLGQFGARIRVLPGDPYSALSTAANQLTDTDLVVIGGDQDRDSLARAWFFLPRMLHGDARVFLSEPSTSSQGDVFVPISQIEMARLAAEVGRVSKRAA